MGTPPKLGRRIGYMCVHACVLISLSHSLTLSLTPCQWNEGSANFSQESFSIFSTSSSKKKKRAMTDRQMLLIKLKYFLLATSSHIILLLSAKLLGPKSKEIYFLSFKMSRWLFVCICLALLSSETIQFNFFRIWFVFFCLWRILAHKLHLPDHFISLTGCCLMLDCKQRCIRGQAVGVMFEELSGFNHSGRLTGILFGKALIRKTNFVILFSKMVFRNFFFKNQISKFHFWIWHFEIPFSKIEIRNSIFLIEFRI